LGLAVQGCACPCRIQPQYVFDCGGGRIASVEYRRKADLMLLEYAGEVFRLPRAVSASGARYSDGHMTFWEKGGTAFLERDGQVIESKCVLRVEEQP